MRDFVLGQRLCIRCLTWIMNIKNQKKKKSTSAFHTSYFRCMAPLGRKENTSSLDMGHLIFPVLAYCVGTCTFWSTWSSVKNVLLLSSFHCVCIGMCMSRRTLGKRMAPCKHITLALHESIQECIKNFEDCSTSHSSCNDLNAKVMHCIFII